MGRYQDIIEHVFNQKYAPGAERVEFSGADILAGADRLGVEKPANIWDLVYSFRHRNELPQSIRDTAPTGQEWVIVNTEGRSEYAFELRHATRVVPDEMLATVKVADATPGIVAKYALGDEQALLAKLRYNRLIDLFTGTVALSLQSHLRTSTKMHGQVETDELYVGVDRRGEHFIFPVQAKGGSDQLGVVQIEADVHMCAEKFPNLTCRAIAAQFMAEDIIALFELQIVSGQLQKVAERHYKLVPPDAVSDADLAHYRVAPE